MKLLETILMMVVLAFCGSMIAVAATAAEPLATWECRERLGLDWARTLVSYQVQFDPGKAKAGEVRLVDAAGTEAPVQLWRVQNHPDGSLASARVSFYGQLPRDGSYRYQLLPGKPAAAPNGPSATTQGGLLMLDNGIVALRLPAPGTVKFDKPPTMHTDHAAMVKLFGKQAENGVAPGPIQGIRLNDGRWVGGSYFFAANPQDAPRLTGYTCTVTEQGPLFCEAVVRYELDNGPASSPLPKLGEGAGGEGGYYQLAARVCAGDPAARIDEQSDLKIIGDWWKVRVMFSLAGGWQDGGWKPDTSWYITSEGRMPGREPDFEQAVEEMGFDAKKYQSVEYGVRKIAYNEPYAKVFDVAAWYPWHPSAFYFGLADSAGVKKGADPARTPFLGIVPLHAGNWRGCIGSWDGMVFSYAAGDVCLNWPLIAQRHPNSLLHTGEYDPDLPFSFLRRQWAIVGGPMQYQDGLRRVRGYDGYINLDDYKEWVLDWPADPKVTYPRLVFDRKLVESLKGRLDEQPGGDVLGKFLYFNDDDARRDSLYKTYTSPASEWTSPLGLARHGLTSGWFSSFRIAQSCFWAGAIDELLSSGKLTDEQRGALRAHLAAVACMLTEPDFNPRGSMVHLGNPNMPINRFMGLPFVAALIPDHPRANEWLDVASQYVRYKLAMNTAPNDAWSELLTYYMSAASHIMQASLVLQKAGRLDASTAELASRAGRFPFYLLAPRDPRFAGARSLPCWGHEGYWMIPTQWLPVAGFMRELDPAFARDMAWAWDQLGRPMEDHHDAGFSERAILHADLLTGLPPDYVPARIGSRWLPGFGATMRAHAGKPDELYFSLRQGYMVSHSDANQGSFVIHAKGAPLTTLSIFQYALHQYPEYIKLNEEFGWHNRVRFDSTSNTGGWPGGGRVSNVHAHAFSDSADYIRALGDYGPQRWTRQVMLVKSRRPGGIDYFVFRDSFRPLDGDAAKLQRTWWYLNTPGEKTLVTAAPDGMTYRSPYGAQLHVQFLQPAAVAAESREATGAGPVYNHAARKWQEAGMPVEDGKDTSIRVKQTATVTGFGPVAPGQDIIVALTPARPDEQLPQFELLSPGVLRVKTGESTDYVFLGPEPAAFSRDGISFTGLAGAVRVFADEVHLVMAEGPGEAGYQGTALRCEVPAARVLPKASLKRGVTEVKAPAHTIAFKLDRPDAKAETVRPGLPAGKAGVTKHTFDGGTAYEFDSPEPIAFDADGIKFSGRRGGIIIDQKAGTTRMVVIDGDEMSSGNLRTWQAGGPYDVTFHQDRITGRYAGLGRILHVTRPAGLDRLPMYALDGQTYAPGTSGDTLILPMLAGEHEFEIRALPQPPIWRNWQAW